MLTKLSDEQTLPDGVREQTIRYYRERGPAGNRYVPKGEGVTVEVQEVTRLRSPKGHFIESRDPRQIEIRSVRREAKAYTLEALHTLLEVMRDKDARRADRIHAAELILAYGWGKPPVVHHFGEEDGNPFSGLTSHEIRLVIERLSASIRPAGQADAE